MKNESSPDFKEQCIQMMIDFLFEYIINNLEFFYY